DRDPRRAGGADDAPAAGRRCLRAQPRSCDAAASVQSRRQSRDHRLPPRPRLSPAANVRRTDRPVAQDRMIGAAGRSVSVRDGHRANMCLSARNRVIRPENLGLAGGLQAFSPRRNKTSLSKVESSVRNFDEVDLTVEISKRILESGWLNVCGRVGPLFVPRQAMSWMLERRIRPIAHIGAAGTHSMEGANTW